MNHKIISTSLVGLVLGLLQACGAPAAVHQIHGEVSLVADAGIISLLAQNGATVEVPVGDVVGKTFVWATTPLGESAANSTPLEVGTGAVPASLQFDFTTTRGYADGPWELALFILVSGGDPKQGPGKNDLAAFDLTPAHAGEPANTGVSVRVRLSGGNENLTLNNTNFIRLAQ